MTTQFLGNFIYPIISAVIAVYIGYRLGKWSKYREILFSKKVEVYSSLSRELVGFLNHCSPSNNISLEQQTYVIKMYLDLRLSLFEATLFMPTKLHEDINKIFDNVDLKLKNIWIFWKRINILKGNKSKIDVAFRDFKKETLAMEEYFSTLPGPFNSLAKSIPTILDMLKKDLGIYKLDNKFY